MVHIHELNKKTLDTFGGIGSLLAGVMCLYFAGLHNEQESIWKVWVAFCVLLLVNGAGMIYFAQRSQQAHPGR